MTKQRLGELLIERGVISEAQLNAALEWQRIHRFKLGAALIELGFATEEQVLSALACRLGFDRIHLDTLTRTPTMRAAALLVPEEIAKAQGVVPIAIDEGTLTVALRDPTNLTVMDELVFRTGRRLRVIVAGEREIWRATARVYLGRCELDVELDAGLDADRTIPIVPLTDVSFFSSAARLSVAA
jgi:type IV pilus assembly protein PilB